MMNCIIVGGGMANKGAQAMTLIAIDYLRRKYPEDRIVILANTNTKEFEDAKLNCEFQIATYKMLRSLSKHSQSKNKTKYKELDVVFSNARVLLDISGYALSSKWNDAIVKRYIEVIECAKSYNVPVYLLPQSFGPFDYAFPKSVYMLKRIKKALEYPQKIFVREQEGYDELKRRFNLSNITLANDMVLSSLPIETKNVFIEPIVRNHLNVQEGSVGIVPNSRLFTVADEHKLYMFYKEILTFLRINGKHVYIVCHSSEDIIMAQEMVNRNDLQEIHIIDNNMYSFEYEDLFQQFDFLIASRYHSIVHALRKGVPCVAIGWADKYPELLHKFDQDEYVVDLRGNIDSTEIVKIIQKMGNCYSKEKTKILDAIPRIQNPDYI